MKLEHMKELQNIFKITLNEISKGRFKSEEQKSALENINCFMSHGKLLLNYLMNIIQLNLKLNTKQNKENVSKY